MQRKFCVELRRTPRTGCVGLANVLVRDEEEQESIPERVATSVRPELPCSAFSTQ